MAVLVVRKQRRQQEQEQVDDHDGSDSVSQQVDNDGQVWHWCSPLFIK